MADCASLVLAHYRNLRQEHGQPPVNSRWGDRVGPDYRRGAPLPPPGNGDLPRGRHQQAYSQQSGGYYGSQYPQQQYMHPIQLLVAEQQQLQGPPGFMQQPTAAAASHALEVAEQAQRQQLEAEQGRARAAEALAQVSQPGTATAGDTQPSRPDSAAAAVPAAEGGPGKGTPAVTLMGRAAEVAETPGVDSVAGAAPASSTAAAPAAAPAAAAATASRPAPAKPPMVIAKKRSIANVAVRK